jgi:hypothetical protein
LVVAGTRHKDHEQVLALDKRQIAGVPGIMEQQIECPHGDVVVGRGAEMQSWKSSRPREPKAVTSPSVMQDGAGTAISALLSRTKRVVRSYPLMV